jgi:hypothetical protein
LHPNFPEYVRLSDLLPEDTPMDQLVATLDEHGLEGIVVKRKDSTYLVARWNIRKRLNATISAATAGSES